jgi:hypothetical protein
MMRNYKNVSGQRKSWCHGWPNRAARFNRGIKRHIEKVFRATQRDAIEEGIEEVEDDRLEEEMALDYDPWLDDPWLDHALGPVL